MKYVKLMADYSSSGLWGHDGIMIHDSDLPVSDILKKKILQWVQWYEPSQYFLSPEERTVNFDLKSFSKIGEEIAKEIKLELPSWIVIYWNEEYADIFDVSKDRDLCMYEITL